MNTQISISRKNIFFLGSVLTLLFIPGFFNQTLASGGCGYSWTEVPIVSPSPTPPVCEFSASDLVIEEGESTVLSWITDMNHYFKEVVFIEPDICEVSESGSLTVFPSETTTYELYAVGELSGHFRSAKCEVTITVTPPEPELPVCDAFSISPSSRVGAGYVTFSWDTTNATNVSINNGVGNVSVDGSKNVYVSESNTYTLTATNNDGTDTCMDTVTVIPPELEIPEIDIIKRDAIEKDDIQKIQKGEDANFEIIVTNIGEVDLKEVEVLDPLTSSCVKIIGNLSVGENVVYTCDGLDIQNSFTNIAYVTGKSVIDDTEVSDEDPTDVVINEDSEQVSCDLFTTNVNGIVGKNSPFNLIWETTGATDVSIDQGVGSVSVDGEKAWKISIGTTFTLTASNGIDTDICTTDVLVKSGGGGSSKPRCNLEISDTKVEEGDTVTISWDNRRTNDILLEDNYGNILIDTKNVEDDENKYDEDEDSIDLKINKDTEFTLNAIRGKRDDECKVSVDIEEGEVAGVSITTNRYQDSIVLASTPYTGFEAGKVLTFIFYLAIGLWAAVVAYSLVLKKAVTSKIVTAEPVLNTYNSVIRETSATMTPSDVEENLIPDNIPIKTETHDTIRTLESHAHSNYTLISSDGLRYVETQGDSLEEQIKALDSIISKAKAKYPKEDNWLVLNKERILSLMT